MQDTNISEGEKWWGWLKTFSKKLWREIFSKSGKGINLESHKTKREPHKVDGHMEIKFLKNKDEEKDQLQHELTPYLKKKK